MVLLYAVGLVLVFHVALLVVFNYNLAPAAANKEQSVMSFGLQRSVREEEDVVLAEDQSLAAKLRSVREGRPADRRTIVELVYTPTAPKRQDANSTLAESQAVNELRGAQAVNELKGAQAVNELKGAQAVNELEGGISSDRWKRLKPPSLLKDELVRDAAAAGMQKGQRTGELRSVLQNAKKGERAQYIADRLKEREEGLKMPVGHGNFEELQKREKQETIKELNRMWSEGRKVAGKKDQEGGGGEGGGEKNAISVEEYFKEVCNETTLPLVECLKSKPRQLSALEASGGDIMLTIRTTVKYHEARLSVLFDTWFGEVDPGNVFIVTDGEDEDLLWKTNSLGECKQDSVAIVPLQ